MGLIARSLEEHGIATICVAMNHDIIAAVKAPRTLFVHFPYGAPLGPAGDRDVQRAVIRNALDVLGSTTAPGSIVESHVDWPD